VQRFNVLRGRSQIRTLNWAGRAPARARRWQPYRGQPLSKVGLPLVAM